MNKIKIDVFISIGFILFALFFLWQTRQFPTFKLFISLSPRLWPEVILILLITCSFLLLLQSTQAYYKQNKMASKSLFTGYRPETFIAMIVCFVSSLALWVLGFFITIPIFLFIFMYILGVKSLKTLIIIPPLATTILGYIFTRIAYIPFPKGIGIFYKINVIFY